MGSQLFGVLAVAIFSLDEIFFLLSTHPSTAVLLLTTSKSPILTRAKKKKKSLFAPVLHCNIQRGGV